MIFQVFLKLAICAESIEIAEKVLENFWITFPEFSVNQEFMPLVGYENVTYGLPYWSLELSAKRDFLKPQELNNCAMKICNFIAQNNWHYYIEPSIEQLEFDAVYHIETNFKNQIKWANLIILPEL